MDKIPCNTCGVIKDRSEFYSKARGQQCKVCKRKRKMIRWYETHEESLAKLKVRSQAYYKTAKGRKVNMEKAYRMTAKYPEKYKARYQLKNAVRLGKVRKLPCEVCLDNEIVTEKVHGHHYLGYLGDNALKVRWLCKDHHLEAHQLLNSLKPTPESGVRR